MFENMTDDIGFDLGANGLVFLDQRTIVSRPIPAHALEGGACLLVGFKQSVERGRLGSQNLQPAANGGQLHHQPQQASLRRGRTASSVSASHGPDDLRIS